MKFIQKETLKLFFILSKIDVSLLLFTHVFPVLRYLSPRKPVFHALKHLHQLFFLDNIRNHRVQII